MVINVAILDLNGFFKFIILITIPFLGLLAWIENKVPNSNEVSATIFRTYCACSFCGKLSNIVSRCSRCKSALYCSKVCHVMHWRFWHEYECVERDFVEDYEESPSHGTHCLLMEPANETSVYSFNEVEHKTYEGDVYYIEGGEKQTSVEPRHAIFSGYHCCAVCGNPSTKRCSRCKAIKYCSQTCQHYDWGLGHKFQCFVEEENSTQAAKVVMPMNSNELEDNVHSSDPLCLEFYPEENANAKALTLSYQEATYKAHKEVEEQLSSLKEELEKTRNENISLQSECKNWKMRAMYSTVRLYSFRKKNEHQLFVLKHENELMSNSEKQARQMINSLSQRLHYLQIAVEDGITERKKQEEFIHMLQNECAEAKRVLQAQNKYVERLTLELHKATQLPMGIAEETRQKLAIDSWTIATVQPSVAAVEEFQTISLSRNPTFTRQGCSICLTNDKDMAFDCGHMTCRDCGSKIRKCHICRKKISNRIRLFPG